MQIAMWHIRKPSTNSRRAAYRLKQPGLHNQIGYIAIPRREFSLITDVRACMPHLFQHQSDHFLLIASVRLGAIYRLQTNRKCNTVEQNIRLLQESEDHRAAYQEK
jgi:hypothetical protein